MESRWRGMVAVADAVLSLTALPGDRHGLVVVMAEEPHAHLLRMGRRRFFADVVGADRQLTVTPVDEDRQAHGPRSPVVAERVERRARTVRPE